MLSVLVAVLTVATLAADSRYPPNAAERLSAFDARLTPGPTVEQQDRVVPPIYVPPEPDHGTPAGHGTFEGRSYRVIQYRHHYNVTFAPGLPPDQPTVTRALTMLCQTMAKFDVRSVVPHTPSPPSDDTWVFETRTGPCIATVFRSTDPRATVVSIQRIALPDQSLWEPAEAHDAHDDEATEPKPSVAREFVRELHVGDFHVVLEQTTLSAARHRLAGTLGQRGDAATSLEWICRTGSEGSERSILWLEAGEIHGNAVGGFEWRRMSESARVDHRCSTAPPGERVTLPAGLRLGMTENDLIEALGRPTLRRGQTLLYRHEHVDPQDRHYSVSNYLDAVIDDSGIVSAIRVWRITGA